MSSFIETSELLSVEMFEHKLREVLKLEAPYGTKDSLHVFMIEAIELMGLQANYFLSVTNDKRGRKKHIRNWYSDPKFTAQYFLDICIHMGSRGIYVANLNFIAHKEITFDERLQMLNERDANEKHINSIAYRMALVDVFLDHIQGVLISELFPRIVKFCMCEAAKDPQKFGLMLLEKYIDSCPDALNYQANDGDVTVLMYAICYQARPEVIEMLINKGARLDVIITKNFSSRFSVLRTMSHDCTVYSPFKIMNLALSSAYYLDKSRDALSYLRTSVPIHRNNNWRVLMKYGVELDPEFGESAFGSLLQPHCFASEDFLINLLVEFKCLFEGLHCKYGNVLQYAVVFGKVKLLQQLLSLGANPNPSLLIDESKLRFNKCTYLKTFAYYDDDDKPLLFTPLTLITMSKRHDGATPDERVEITRLLLDYGSTGVEKILDLPVWPEDRFGKVNLIQWAALKGETNLVNLLKSYIDTA